MQLNEILKDKSLKPSEKPGIIAELILLKEIQVAEILQLLNSSKDPDKAAMIEGLEHASLKNPELISPECFRAVTLQLSSKAPRVKWESARVIANSANLHREHLEEAAYLLVQNSEHPGTVVRWAAATALGEILKTQTSLNQNLIPAVESILEREEKNSIRKIYLNALKKVKK